MGEAGEKRQLGRPSRNWKENASYSNGSSRNMRDSLDWIHLAQNRVKWPAVVNGTESPIPLQKSCKILIAEEISAPPEEFSFMEFIYFVS